MSHHHQQSFGYPEFSSIQDSSPMQSFELSHDLYGLHTGIEMLQMMPSYHVQHGVVVCLARSSWQQSNRTLVDEDSNPFGGCSDARLCDSDNYELKNSVYLGPAQELLGEFCSLEEAGGFVWKQESRVQKADHQPPLFTNMDSFELQSRKAKLFSMLEQVDGRYKRYCDQMRAVVSSFEAVAGPGSAAAYATLAWKAMSRHFRGLRDGIVGQILATKMAMGERDPVVPEATKGETPRLKLLDRRIRQQKMFRQGEGLDGHPWRLQRGLPERSVTILRAWLFEHFLHPYPSVVDKHVLARQAGLSRSQVSNWFINARVRLWKPMIEEMYLDEEKEQESTNQSSSEPTENPNPSPPRHDQKPLLPVHVSHGIGSGSPSSIMVTNNTHHVYVTRPRAEDLDAVYFDRFSSYHNNNACSSNQNFGNGVSLTLGLQQSTIFFSRNQQAIDDCEQVAFSGGESIAS